MLYPRNLREDGEYFIDYHQVIENPQEYAMQGQLPERQFDPAMTTQRNGASAVAEASNREPEKNE